MSKKQYTFYLKEEDEVHLNEIYTYRLLYKNKTTKSDIICEGLQMLHQREYLDSTSDNIAASDNNIISDEEN